MVKYCHYTFSIGANGEIGDEVATGGNKGRENKNFRMYPYMFGVSIHHLLSPLD